jgi:hypothetical protein
MTTSMLDVEFVHASHSELLRQAEQARLVRAARAEREADRSTQRVWWRASLRLRRRQVPQLARPVVAL